MHCKNCDATMIPLLKNRAPHIGAYCACCGKWIKWLSKTEVLKYTNLKFNVTEEKQRLNSLYGMPCATDDDTLDELTDSEVPW